MKLYGCRGCGSAAIEVMLEHLGETCELECFEWEDEAAWARLAAINPWRQVPTLVLDDGVVLSESVAIILWLLARHPQSPLAPPVGSTAHATMLRWFLHLAANVYAPIGVRDFPGRWMADVATHATLRAGAVQRIEAAWRVMETTVSPAPFILGPSLGALDIYVAMLTRWKPGRPWFEEHCPRLIAAARATEADPIVRRIWEANF